MHGHEVGTGALQRRNAGPVLRPGSQPGRRLSSAGHGRGEVGICSQASSSAALPSRTSSQSGDAGSPVSSIRTYPRTVRSAIVAVTVPPVSSVVYWAGASGERTGLERLLSHPAHLVALPGQLVFETSSGCAPVKAPAAVALPRSWYSSQAVA